MKRQSIIILIFFLFIPFLVFSDTGERYYEAEGKFSICPPKNWAVTSLPGLKYKIIYTEAINGFGPNILIADEYYEGNLQNYNNLSNENLRKIFPDIEFLKNENFKTNTRITGYKSVFITPNAGRLLRQYSYVFQNRNSKFIITCSVPNSEGNRYEKLFDECVMTFNFEE